MPWGLQARAWAAVVAAGNDLHTEAKLAQTAQDVVFDAEIEGDDGNVRRRQGRGLCEIIGAARQFKRGAQLAVLVPEEGFFVGDFPDVIHAGQAGPVAGAGDGFGVRDGGAGDEAVECAADAEFLGEGAGVNALDARDAVFFEIVGEGAFERANWDDGGEFADGEAGDVGLPGFDVLIVDAVVADERDRSW